MRDLSPARRRMGRLLLAGGVVALPLTASITYAASTVETIPMPPSAPAAPLPFEPPAPPVPPAPPAAPRAPRVVAIHSDAPLSEMQRKHFEEIGRQWEKQGAAWRATGEEWRKWGEKQRALALAEVPEVSNDCAQARGQATRSWTDSGGRRHVVICERLIHEQATEAERQAQIAHDEALTSLRGARATIAANGDLSQTTRQQVLADLDREIRQEEGRN